MKKKYPIVMLSTETASGLLIHPKGNLHQTKYYGRAMESTLGKDIYQNLHILSDEEIKEGDTYVNEKGRLLLHKNILNPKGKKVIATTDKSLLQKISNPVGFDYPYRQVEFPQIPESFLPIFVKAYNEGNLITEVELEYEVFTETVGTSEFDFMEQDSSKLKTTESNEVIISLPEVKLYSREQVKDKIRHFFTSVETLDYLTEEDCEDWINNNL